MIFLNNLIHKEFLLVWQKFDDELILHLTNTGSHSDLFGKYTRSGLGLGILPTMQPIPQIFVLLITNLGIDPTRYTVGS